MKTARELLGGRTTACSCKGRGQVDSLCFHEAQLIADAAAKTTTKAIKGAVAMALLGEYDDLKDVIDAAVTSAHEEKASGGR